MATQQETAILAGSCEQRRVAEEAIADMNVSSIWPGKLVTEVTPAGPFWGAEPEHQGYLEGDPAGYACPPTARLGVSPEPLPWRVDVCSPGCWAHL